MSFWKWSQTAGSNSTADGSINWAEGQAPSSVNDSARAMMAAAAKYRDDIAGAITTGGTSTAYTVSSYQVFDTLAHMNGAMVSFVPHTTSGATVTLNVDSLGAKPLRSAPSIELPSGTLVQGTPYVATYNNSDGAWYLKGFFGNPYTVPIGGMMPYLGPTAPNSSFVLPYGQAISRTTYATLYALTGNAFGAGDGSTTFNVIDLRGRIPVGQDNMGGSAASRVTLGGSGINGLTYGANGGGETSTLVTGNLPAYTPSGSVGITDPGHVHSYFTGDYTVPAGTGAAQTVTNPNNRANNHPVDSNTTGITASFTGNAQGGTSTPFSNMPPCIIIPYILRVI